MNCANNISVRLVPVLIIAASLLNCKLAAGRRPINIRDYIATDHTHSASAIDVEIASDEPSKELSRKEMVELLHSGQYFQDIFMEQLTPMKLQFGHVCENPHEWQQRFEQSDFDANRFQGKVRWGNANGDYGEHYWDLGHAGRK